MDSLKVDVELTNTSLYLGSSLGLLPCKVVWERQIRKRRMMCSAIRPQTPKIR